MARLARRSRAQRSEYADNAGGEEPLPLARTQRAAQRHRSLSHGALELFWDKHRIIEVYLNVVEWGDGIYGAETASRFYFGTPASALTSREAALLAAVLPNPRAWSPVDPTAYIAERAARIREHMPEMAVPSATACR